MRVSVNLTREGDKGKCASEEVAEARGARLDINASSPCLDATSQWIESSKQL